MAEYDKNKLIEIKVYIKEEVCQQKSTNVTPLFKAHDSLSILLEL